MTDHEGNRKIYLGGGIQEGLEIVDYCPNSPASNTSRPCLILKISGDYRGAIKSGH